MKIRISPCNSHVPATQLFLLMTRDLPSVCQIPESSVSAKDCTSKLAINLYFSMMETLFNFYVSFLIRLKQLFRTKVAIRNSQKDDDQFSDLLQSSTLFKKD